MLCILLASVDSPQDKRKLELLYEKYNRLMYVVAMRVLHHPQDAEDACLTSWEKVIKNLDKILYLFLDYPHKYYVFKYFEV